MLRRAMKAYLKPELATPLEHGRALHAERPGQIAIATGRPWRQQLYAVSDLPDILPALAGQPDTYLSANRFRGCRRITHLCELGALFCDLDYYKTADYADLHPLAILDDALDALRRAQIPQPTLWIKTGRGVVVYWLHSAVPRGALPRWMRCQEEIYHALKPFGADAGCRDAARVLRLVGTINSKSGALVEPIAPKWHTWDFEDLADEILPLRREDLDEMRDQRRARRAQKPSERRRFHSLGLTPRTLWEARLSDLQNLREIRWFGDLPPGERDHWLFITGVAMSWLAYAPRLRRELFSLAKQVAGWGDAESKSRMHAIFRTAHAHQRGEKVSWRGVEVDARYRFRNQTIIERLQITAEEERQMSAIISYEEKLRRQREHKERRRREQGIEDRFVVSEQNRIAAQRLRSQGLTQAEISKRLCLSERHVRRLLGDNRT
jgi:hypothetical protein